MWAEIRSMNYLTIINFLLLLHTMCYWWNIESILSLTIWFSWTILLEWHEIEHAELQRELQLNKPSNATRNAQRMENF